MKDQKTRNPSAICIMASFTLLYGSCRWKRKIYYPKEYTITAGLLSLSNDSPEPKITITSSNPTTSIRVGPLILFWLFGLAFEYVLFITGNGPMSIRFGPSNWVEIAKLKAYYIRLYRVDIQQGKIGHWKGGYDILATCSTSLSSTCLGKGKLISLDIQHVAG